MSDWNDLEGKKILVGVTSGIAIYKACSLVRLFLRHGAAVKVVMTENATKLVSPLTFQSLTHSPVHVSMFNPLNSEKIEHIHLAEWAEIFVIAPATANTIAKLVNGLCDNLLTTVALALSEETPIVVAPAMNDKMWKNVFVQENIQKLRKRKNCHIIKPARGELASGKVGEGRMAKITEIFETAGKALVSQKMRKK